MIIRVAIMSLIRSKIIYSHWIWHHSGKSYYLKKYLIFIIIVTLTIDILVLTGRYFFTFVSHLDSVGTSHKKCYRVPILKVIYETIQIDLIDMWEGKLRFFSKVKKWINE